MTKKQVMRTLLIGLFPALWWLVPASLVGQVSTLPGAALYAGATPAELELMAEDLFSTPSRFGEAGDLLERAGRMLAVEDPASVDLLIRAARLQYFAGQLQQARACMKEAGWRALGQGQLQVAANAYADAGIIAVAQHDRPAAEEAVKIVNLLAQWPGVTKKQSQMILERID